MTAWDGRSYAELHRVATPARSEQLRDAVPADWARRTYPTR